MILPILDLTFKVNISVRSFSFCSSATLQVHLLRVMSKILMEVTGNEIGYENCIKMI